MEYGIWKMSLPIRHDVYLASAGLPPPHVGRRRQTDPSRAARSSRRWSPSHPGSVPLPARRGNSPAVWAKRRRRAAIALRRRNPPAERRRSRSLRRKLPKALAAKERPLLLLRSPRLSILLPLLRRAV